MKDWILSCLSTQKPRVGVWQGPKEIREESRFPYLPWKYLVWNLPFNHTGRQEKTVEEKPTDLEV